MNHKKSIKIAIASGKGGTGKTTLSTNLAAYLAEFNHVVLVDLDVEEPNSGLFIKGQLKGQQTIYKFIPEWIADKCTFCDICQKSCNYHAVLQLGKAIVVFPELCHSCFACSYFCPEGALPMKSKRMGIVNEYVLPNMSFVESKLEIGEEQAVPLIKKTKKIIYEKYAQIDFVIIDAPPGTSCPMIETVKDSDFVVLVTEPTPFGLYDVSLAVEVVKKLNRPFGIVINRHSIGNQEIFNYCNQNNIPVLASIPNKREIAQYYAQGKLLYQDFKEVKIALTQIINEIQNFFGKQK